MKSNRKKRKQQNRNDVAEARMRLMGWTEHPIMHPAVNAYTRPHKNTVTTADLMYARSWSHLRRKVEKGDAASAWVVVQGQIWPQDQQWQP